MPSSVADAPTHQYPYGAGNAIIRGCAVSTLYNMYGVHNATTRGRCIYCQLFVRSMSCCAAVEKGI